jgi:hypothetical protein
VRHESADILGVPGDQGQGLDGTTAAGEQVDRPRVQRGDQPVRKPCRMLPPGAPPSASLTGSICR